MADLIFTPYARMRMTMRHLPEEAVYHIVEDADEIIDRDDGRTEYIGEWESQAIVVVIEDDGKTVVTMWDRKRQRPRRR